ncbi:MAG: esterase/lipase family protein [Bacillota bacterium]
MGNTPKKYDLVLVHGLTNRHRWGHKFLEACTDHWGSGRVFVIYLNRDSGVSTAAIKSKRITFAGKNNCSAGCDYISKQAKYMEEKVNILQKHGLGRHFYIIAHSMGGLVSRFYSYNHPGAVAGLVTLGTPHHGSPLASTYSWLGRIALGAKNAFENLTPRWVEEFNRKYPVEGCQMYDNGKVYTIRGSAGGRPWEWGWGGELFLGWHHLKWLCGTDSDGLVPYKSALIDGARHLADLPGCHHLELVRDPRIVEICSGVLL